MEGSVKDSLRRRPVDGDQDEKEPARWTVETGVFQAEVTVSAKVLWWEELWGDLSNERPGGRGGGTESEL